MSNTKRILVSFTEKQWEIIDQLRGELGDNDAVIVKNIVISWLIEKSFISDSIKYKNSR